MLKPVGKALDGVEKTRHGLTKITDRGQERNLHLSLALDLLVKCRLPTSSCQTLCRFVHDLLGFCSKVIYGMG